MRSRKLANKRTKSHFFAMPKQATGSQVIMGNGVHLGELLFPVKKTAQAAHEIMSFHDVQTLFLLQGWLPSPDTLRFVLKKQLTKAQRVDIKKTLMSQIVNSRVFEDSQQLPKISFLAVQTTHGQNEVIFLDIKTPDEAGPGKSDALRQACRKWNMLPGLELPECLSFSSQEVLKALKPNDTVIKIRRVPPRLLKDSNFRSDFPGVLESQLTIVMPEDGATKNPRVVSMYAICTMEPGKQQFTDEILVHIQTPDGTVAREVAGQWRSGARVKFGQQGFTFPLQYAGQNMAADAGFNSGHNVPSGANGTLKANGGGTNGSRQAVNHGLPRAEANGKGRFNSPAVSQSPDLFATVAQPVPPPVVKTIEHCPQCGYHRVTAPNGSFKPQPLKPTRQPSRKQERAVAALQVPSAPAQLRRYDDIEMSTAGPLDSEMPLQPQSANQCTDVNQGVQLPTHDLNGVDASQEDRILSVSEATEQQVVEDVGHLPLSTAIEPSSEAASATGLDEFALSAEPQDKPQDKPQDAERGTPAIQSVFYLDASIFGNLLNPGNNDEPIAVDPIVNGVGLCMPEPLASPPGEFVASNIVHADITELADGSTSTSAPRHSIGSQCFASEKVTNAEPDANHSPTVKPLEDADANHFMGILPFAFDDMHQPEEDQSVSTHNLNQQEDSQELLMRLNRESPPGSPPPVTSRGPVQSLDAYIEEDDAKEVMYEQHYTHRDPRDRSASNNSVIHWQRKVVLSEALDWLDREELNASGNTKQPDDAKSLGSEIDESELKTLVVDGFDAEPPAHPAMPPLESSAAAKASPSGTPSAGPSTSLGRHRSKRGRGYGFPLSAALPTRAESKSNNNSQDAEYVARRERPLIDPLDRPVSPDLSLSNAELQQRAAAASFLSARLEAKMREQAILAGADLQEAAASEAMKIESHGQDSVSALGGRDVGSTCAQNGLNEEGDVALLFPDVDFSDDEDVDPGANRRHQARRRGAKPYNLDEQPRSSSVASYRHDVDRNLSSEDTAVDSIWTNPSSQPNSDTNALREEHSGMYASTSSSTWQHLHQDEAGPSKEQYMEDSQAKFVNDLDYQLALSLALSQAEDEQSFLSQVDDGYEEYFDTQSGPLDYDLFQ